MGKAKLLNPQALRDASYQTITLPHAGARMKVRPVSIEESALIQERFPAMLAELTALKESGRDLMEMIASEAEKVSPAYYAFAMAIACAAAVKPVLTEHPTADPDSLYVRDLSSIDIEAILAAAMPWVSQFAAAVHEQRAAAAAQKGAENERVSAQILGAVPRLTGQG